MNKFNYLILTILITAFFVTHLGATVVINPVIINFSKDINSQEIILENQSDKEKIFEVSIKEWKQENNDYVYIETNKIVVFPLMSKIPPKSKQKFRLVLKTRPSEPIQATYRLFFNEIAEKSKEKAKAASFSFLFKLLVPVFVEGNNFIKKNEKVWSTKINEKNKNITISLKNNGTNYVKIRNISVSQLNKFKDDNWQYILPGATRSWAIPFKNKTPFNFIDIKYSYIEDNEEKKISDKVYINEKK